jgi:CHAT domain-containing protein
VRGRDRQDPIELLVLNACETASGDDLATLGIAGTAVKAGARSAIASLWTLDDAPSVKFTEILYSHLQQPDVSKAEALQKAQLALLQDPLYRHPRYWSPYILAGNWLPLTSSR